jgi:hypothetical protein
MRERDQHYTYGGDPAIAEHVRYTCLGSIMYPWNTRKIVPDLQAAAYRIWHNEQMKRFTSALPSEPSETDLESLEYES